MIGRRSSVSTSFMLAALRVLHVDTSNAPARRASIEECPSTPWVSRDSSSRVSLYNPRTSRTSRKHGVREVRVPWAEPHSRFTLLFERLAIDVLGACDVAAAAGLLRLSWDEAWHLMDRAVA